MNVFVDVKLSALAPVLAANAVTVWLLAAGQLSMFELLLLISLELVGLQLIVGASERWGRRARGKRRRFPAGILGVLVQTLAIAGLAALFWPFQLMQMWLFGASLEDWQRVLDPLAAIAGSQVKWPLLITLTTAVWSARRGENERSHQQLAGRLLSLALGGFPFLAPVLLLGGATVRTLLRTRAEGSGRRIEPRLLAMGAATVVLMFGGGALLPWLFSLGPMGWMLSFLSTKIALELIAAVVQGRQGQSRPR